MLFSSFDGRYLDCCSTAMFDVISVDCALDDEVDLIAGQ